MLNSCIKVIDLADNRSAEIPTWRLKNEEVLRLADLAEYFPGATGLYSELQDQRTELKQYLSYTGEPHLNNLNFYLAKPEEGWQSQYFVTYETVIPTPTGLALSGGGFRATLFHLGALQRLKEIGVLSQVGTVTSVSGGSIISALLAVHWNDLKAHNFSEEAFDALIRRPVRKIAEYNFAARIMFHPKEVFKRLFPGKSSTSATSLANAYINAERQSKEAVKAELQAEFEHNTLTKAQIDLLQMLDKTGFDKPLSQALPDPQGMEGPPLFVFCGCDMRSGRPIYFTKHRVSHDLYAPAIVTRYHRYDIPENEASILADKVTLAQAVAASSAHPFFAQPLKIGYKDAHQKESVLPVIDGGVVDNIGIDPLLLPNGYKCLNNDPAAPLPHVNIFISNAGAPAPEVDEPSNNIVARLLRSLSLVGVQSERLRVRMLKENINSKKMYGAWWGLNDLWRYYLASKATVRDNQIRDLARNDFENDPAATVQEEAILKSNERKPIQLQPLIDFLNDPNNTFLKFTDIVRPLGSWNEVKALIRLVTTFRTDLNYINNKEQNMLESMGYLICTYNVECYAAPFMKRRMVGHWNNVEFDPYGRYKRFLHAPTIRSAFSHSQNVFTSFFRNTVKRIVKSKTDDSTSFAENNAPANPVGA